jgi:hypothetical protein
MNQDTYEGDITNPLSLNGYTYGHNNPLRYKDPSGHCVWDACIAETCVAVLGTVAVVGGVIAVANAPIGGPVVIP